MRFHKHIAVFLAVYYFSISAGFAVNLHFCGGELESISTVLTEVVCEKEAVIAKCCSKKKKSANGCCDDSVIDLTEVDDETTLHSDVFLVSSPAIITNYPKLFRQIVSKQKIQALPYYTFQSNAPPLYKLYCTYIYYA